MIWDPSKVQSRVDTRKEPSTWANPSQKTVAPATGKSGISVVTAYVCGATRVKIGLSCHVGERLVSLVMVTLCSRHTVPGIGAPLKATAAANATDADKATSINIDNASTQ